MKLLIFLLCVFSLGCSRDKWRPGDCFIEVTSTGMVIEGRMAKDSPKDKYCAEVKYKGVPMPAVTGCPLKSAVDNDKNMTKVDCSELDF